MIGIVVVGLLVVGLLLEIRSARRFIDEQHRLGRWDDEGPLVETSGPPIFGSGGAMRERLEVAGQWHAPVVRDRRTRNDALRADDSDRVE